MLCIHIHHCKREFAVIGKNLSKLAFTLSLQFLMYVCNLPKSFRLHVSPIHLPVGIFFFKVIFRALNTPLFQTFLNNVDFHSLQFMVKCFAMPILWDRKVVTKWNLPHNGLKAFFEFSFIYVFGISFSFGRVKFWIFVRATAAAKAAKAAKGSQGLVFA